MVSTMAENDSKKCGLNLIDAVDSIVLSSSVLLVGVCGLLISYSIDQLVIGIVVCIGLLILIGLLWLIYFCKSKCSNSKHLFNVIIICIRLWCSCVLSLMSSVDTSDFHNGLKTAITGVLLASIGIKAIWSFVQRSLGLIKYSPSPVTWAEVLELVGFLVTRLIYWPEDKTFFSKCALCLILVSFAVIVVAVRLAACFYNIYTIFIVIAVVFCQEEFFNTIDVPFYNAALVCFAGRLFMDPLSDLFSRNISINERLNCVFLSTPECLQKVFIIIVIVFECVFLFTAVVFYIYHKAWYWIILSIFLLFYWLISGHLYFICLCWKFSNKISECTKAHKALGKTSLEKMMATKDMRLQAQLSHCLAFNTFGSTVLLGAVTLLIPDGEQPWHKDKKAALAASFLIVVLVEGMFYAATDTLRKSLPGTCTACVIMPPSTSHRQLNELRRSIMDFCDRNAIPCSIESFVDGLSIQTLEGKLNGFFAQTNPATSQRRYDSYLVFYCGDVDRDGKWELTGGKFKFENMQRLWNNCNTEGFQSRLILIQDAKHSKDWLEKIANDENNVVAIQTCKLSPSVDPETGVVPRVGDFTRDWVEFNSSTENSINWKETGRKIKAVYKVSPPWSDNEFRVPSEEDMTEFTSKFPVKLQCLITIALEIAEFKEKTICPTCWKRFMMSWFPPPFIDTGHGFKLVKS